MVRRRGECLTNCSFDEGRVLFNLPLSKTCKSIGKQGEKEGFFFIFIFGFFFEEGEEGLDRKSTRLNSSHRP